MTNKFIDEQNPNYQIPINDLIFEEIPLEKFFRIAGKLFHFHDSPSFDLMDIPLDQVRPLTRHVYQRRLDKSDNLIEMYQRFQIPLFKPARSFCSNSKIQIICPPIVEVHDTEYVLCDGTHRVYKARQAGLTSITVLVVKDTLIPLPGDANEWHHIRALADEVPVSDNFINFKREYLTGYTWIFNGEKCWMEKADYDSI